MNQTAWFDLLFGLNRLFSFLGSSRDKSIFSQAILEILRCTFRRKASNLAGLLKLAVGHGFNVDDEEVHLGTHRRICLFDISCQASERDYGHR